MSTILPRVEYLTLTKHKTLWGWYVVTGWCEGQGYTMRYDHHKPVEHIARRGIMDLHKAHLTDVKQSA